MLLVLDKDTQADTSSVVQFLLKADQLAIKWRRYNLIQKAVTFAASIAQSTTICTIYLLQRHNSGQAGNLLRNSSCQTPYNAIQSKHLTFTKSFDYGLPEMLVSSPVERRCSYFSHLNRNSQSEPVYNLHLDCINPFFRRNR